MPRQSTWDTELYEAKHNFVWKFGEGVLDLLDPKPEERILDVGCGTGHLTQTIAERGAAVVGFDSSSRDDRASTAKLPRLQFILGDAAKMEFRSEFDAVFSNAALHWMKNASQVAKGSAGRRTEAGRAARD